MPQYVKQGIDQTGCDEDKKIDCCYAVDHNPTVASFNPSKYLGPLINQKVCSDARAAYYCEIRL